MTVRGAVYSKMRRAVVRSKWRGMSAVRDDVVEKLGRGIGRRAAGGIFLRSDMHLEAEELMLQSRRSYGSSGMRQAQQVAG